MSIPVPTEDEENLTVDQEIDFFRQQRYLK